MARPRNTAEKPHEELDELLERLGGDAKYIRLYRMDSGAKVYLAKLGPYIELDDIRDKWGGGTFLIQLCAERGRFLGQREVEIAGRPKDPDAPDPGATRIEYSPTPSNAHAPPRTVEESVAQLHQMLQEMRNPPAAAQQGNPLEMATALITAGATAIGPIVEIFKDRRPKGEGGNRAVQMMEAYQNGLRTGVMLMKKHGGGEVGSQDILGRMLDTIGGLAGKGAAPAAEDPLALNPGAPAATAELGVSGQTWVKVVAPHMPRLQALARQGKDPHLYADLLLSEAPDSLLEMLMTQLERGEDFWRELESAFPGTDRAWFQELLNRVWLGCQPDEGGAENPTCDVSPDPDAT